MAKEKVKIKFTENAVKKYLDKCIDFWRAKDETPIAFEVDAELYHLRCKHYIDAYQSIRTSLFGKLKD